MIPAPPELLVIASIGVLLFGAKRIPRLARSLGESAGEFRKGREELESELDDVQAGIEDESNLVEPGVAGTNPGSEVE